MSAKSRDDWREKNPLKHAYNSLKNNAKRRNKHFDLTFEQFKEFAIKVDYVTKKGRGRNAYHVDRKDEEGGYTLSNLQLLTNIENLRKYVAFKYRDRDGTHFTTITQEPVNDEDYPF